MSAADDPAYLLVELTGQHGNQVNVLDTLAAAIPLGGGEVLAFAPAGRVSCLEPGTVAAGMLIARWTDPQQLTNAASQALLPMLRSGLPHGAEPNVLRVDGLPSRGLPELPDIPTLASVPAAPATPRNALMVIRGSVTDPPSLDRYRDVILPMLKERGAYYEVFVPLRGSVTPLCGRWDDAIFAISRWPTRAAAEDFWYCERYQRTAIPLRLGAGGFAVHLLDAREDRRK